jgi:hypothetical protein
MKLLPVVTLVIAGAAVVGCGTTRENRYNETAYADHSAPRTYYDHDVVYRSPADDDVDVVYVRPAYRVVPRGQVIYGDDGHYYYYGD